MNAKKIAELYRELLSLDSGAHAVSFDLHIHSPASKDFIAPKNMPDKDKYLSILNEALENHIEIIAIADHNTFSGYNKLVAVQKESRQIRNKYKDILVLCGIEITCYSNHLLAMFDTDFSEEQQNQFLHDIGIEREAQGTESAMADELSPSALLKKINDYGGISILAHADAEKGFFYPFFSKKGQEISFKGKSLAKILKSPYLYGIQVCSEYGEARIKDIISNSDYIRNDRKLPFLYFSDSHGVLDKNVYTGKSGKAIGTVMSKAKLSFKSFNAVKLALSDVDTRIIKEEISTDYPQIIGCAIKSDILKKKDSEYALFKFSPQMNCIIGSRGTGKSTILGIIRDIISYNTYNDYQKIETDYNDRYITAIVFIQVNGQVHAISNDDTGKKYHSSYIKSALSDSFKAQKEDDNFLRLFLTKTYEQGELYEYYLHSEKTIGIIDDFIMWKNYEVYGDYIKTIAQGTGDVGVLFEKCMKLNKNLLEFIKNEDLEKTYLRKYYEVLSAYDAITDLREKFICEINKILKGKVKLRITYEIDDNTNDFLIKQFPKQVISLVGGYYQHEVEIREFIKSIIEKSKVRPRFDFFAMLITDQIDEIIKQYCLPNDKKTTRYLREIQKAVHPTQLMLFLKNGIHMEYNVNSGMENSNPIFRRSTQLSLGQNAVALLLIILTASQDLKDNRPLLMDQPEDDLDNSYIYNTLVEEFRRSKANRQLIISTHNANIPVSSDAENIIVLKYNGEYGYLDNNGSLDNPAISESVLDILEGGELAMRSRNEKYRNIIKITN